MSDAHANFAFSVVSVAPSPATSGTTLTVLSTTGWPAVPFNATVWPAGSNPMASNAEIVRVTANTSGAFTITRTQESTSARTIVVGDILSAGPTALTFTDAEGYALFCGHAAWSPADGVTYYWGAFPVGAPSTTADLETIIVPKAGTITAIRLTMLIAGTNGSNENLSFILRKNGSDVLTITSTKTLNGGTNTRINLSYTGLSVAVVAGDYLEFKEACPSYATNPTNILQSGHILIT
jgi:hypothetical protein